MKRLLVFIVFTLMSAACQPLAPAATVPDAPPTVLLPTPSAVSVTMADGILAFDWREEESWLIVLDPFTGGQFVAATPIRLGHNFFHAFSPDGRTLAAVSMTGSKVTLHVIDLTAWQETTADLKIPRTDYFSAVRYSPDGRMLVIVAPGKTNMVYLVDVAAKAVTLSAEIGFYARAAAFTRAGSGVMLYGAPQEYYSGVTMGDPQVALLNTSDLAVDWQASLPGIKDGVYPQAESTENLHTPGAAFQYTPGLAFAPDRDALYIVPGDSEQLITVDFSEQAVSNVAIARQPSLLERLLAWTASVAHAKIMDGTSKQMVISPDGARLYIIGMTNAFSKMSNGEFKLDRTPLDLQVVNTADGALIKHAPAEAEMIVLARDGSALYLVGIRAMDYSRPFTAIVDPATLETRATLEGIELQPRQRLNGEAVLVSLTYTSDGRTASMAVYDPMSLQVIGEWHPKSQVGWLYP